MISNGKQERFYSSSIPQSLFFTFYQRKELLQETEKPIESTQRRKLNSVRVSERLLPNVMNPKDLV